MGFWSLDFEAQIDKVNLTFLLSFGPNPVDFSTRGFLLSRNQLFSSPSLFISFILLSLKTERAREVAVRDSRRRRHQQREGAGRDSSGLWAVGLGLIVLQVQNFW